jgi:hypothetical protein
MLTKMKLALGLTTLLAVGATSLAVANTGSPSADNATQTERGEKRAEWKQKMLEKYDVNHNGKLDPEERKQMLDDRADRWFDKLDVNKDGVVSKDEFRTGVEKMGMRMAKKLGRRHHARGQGGGRQGGAPVGGNQ